MIKSSKLIITAAFIFIAGAFSSAQDRIVFNQIQVGAAPMWETPIGDTIRGVPHLQASSVVLVGEGGNVKSFFMSGTPLWDFNARGTAVPHIARSYEAATYVCSTEGLFMAVNRVGRELWRLDLGKPVSYSPVVGWDGRVFITVDSTVTCRTASGHPLWTLDLESPVAFAPILDRTGSVATVLQNMDFVKINQFSYTERIRLNRVPVMIISLNEGEQQSYVLMYQNGETEKIVFNNSAAEGNKLTRSNFVRLPAPPAASAGLADKFAVTLRDGRTLCYDASGSVLWTRNSHEAVEERGRGSVDINQAKMIFDERGVYAITTRGVSAFTAEGRRRFVHKLSVECSGVPGFSDEGILYACGNDNVLRVFKIDSKPRTVLQSKYYGPEPEGRYGMDNPPHSPWYDDSSRYTEDNQNNAYRQIEAAIKSGQLGKNEPVYVAYIMEMVGFFIGSPQTSAVRPLVRPEQRIRLINLLALIGSRETISFLWHIFDRDPEPSIRRACADAIGVIGVDPTGRSFYSYNYLLTPNNPNIDPQLVLAASSSIANICRFSGPPLANEGIRILRYFTNLPSVPNVVKAQIRAELDGLFNDGLDQPLY
ncbi:MAG: PQQ-like beta-propeller repeat protein [Treponema sp.]|nr:PQQ-like beta-propeller repeat protein [Treponema sp.]MCL2271539.1 PQQ-like beta-propeller repeat protein [Treponema sp.]